MKLPQLTIRDLFWLVLVVACLSAWWLEHRQLTAWDDALRQEVWKHGGEVLIENGKPEINWLFGSPTDGTVKMMD